MFKENDEVYEIGIMGYEKYVLPNVRNHNRLWFEFDYHIKDDIHEYFGKNDIKEYLDWETITEIFLSICTFQNIRKLKL